MAEYTVIEVNAWTLRCMFNQSRIVERYETGEFSVAPRDKGNPTKWPNHPKDTRGHMYTFRDKDGKEVATAHRYTSPDGSVIFPFDPKTLKIGDLRYTIHPDPAIANPENWLRFKWLKLCYGWVRRNIICPVFGPLDVLPWQSFSTVDAWELRVVA